MESRERQKVRAELDQLKPFLSAYLSQNGRSALSREEGDIAALLKFVLISWDRTFRALLPRVARSWVHEIVDIRNRWAHEASFSAAEAERAVDTIQHFASAIGAPASTSLGFKPGNSKASGQAVDHAPKSFGKFPSQRSVMREIFVRHSDDHERIVREYAHAEQNGRVPRKSNSDLRSAEAYARALLADGLRKGWLKS